MMEVDALKATQVRKPQPPVARTKKSKRPVPQSLRVYLEPSHLEAPAYGPLSPQDPAPSPFKLARRRLLATSERPKAAGKPPAAPRRAPKSVRVRRLAARQAQLRRHKQRLAAARVPKLRTLPAAPPRVPLPRGAPDIADDRAPTTAASAASASGVAEPPAPSPVLPALPGLSAPTAAALESLAPLKSELAARPRVPDACEIEVARPPSASRRAAAPPGSAHRLRQVDDDVTRFAQRSEANSP